MVQIIKKLEDIDYDNSDISILASILQVDNEGSKELKRPFRFTIKLESSGETIQCISWNFEFLKIIKEGTSALSLYELACRTGMYKDQPQLVLSGINKTEKESKLKVIFEDPTEADFKREYSLIISSVKNNNLKQILNKLIMENPKFFSWPAATAVHHAYPGGLAKHSLSVCNIALKLWENYKGENIDRDLIISGALLHDIGKLFEYNQDGSRTKIGDLYGHPFIGAEMISNAAKELNLNIFSSIEIVILTHIVLTHHGELEFGAVAYPQTLEAVIVSQADTIDAKAEASLANIRNINPGTQTERLLSTKSKLLRWK